MKKYIHPTCEFVVISSADIVTTSESFGLVLSWNDE